MKKLLILALAVLIGGSMAMAQTTAPSPTLTRVLVIPFKLAGDTSSHSWISGAIQESLVSTVAGNANLQTLALSQPIAGSDSVNALAAAKDAGASLVVFGSYQFSDNQLRVTGQAVDVSAGRTVTTLTATGPVLDLFKIEDSLGSQLSSALPQAPSNVPVVTYGPDQSTTPPPSNVVVNAPQATDAYAASAPVPYYTYSPYPVYSSPYYTYGCYPTYSYPIFISGGFGFGRFGGGFRTFPRGGVGIHFGGGFAGGRMGRR